MLFILEFIFMFTIALIGSYFTAYLFIELLIRRTLKK
jgi:hypothetical protein